MHKARTRCGPDPVSSNRCANVLGRKRNDWQPCVKVSCAANRTRRKIQTDGFQLHRERADCQQRISEVTAERERLKSRSAKIDSALAELQRSVQTTESALREATAEKAKLDARYVEQLRLLGDAESRFRVLESMADSYEGYFQGRAQRLGL